MNIKYKVILLIIFILLTIAIAMGSSYAMWVTTVTQEGVNAITSDCFEIEIEGNKAITLINTFPMKDGQGVYETPYTFTVKNICNHGADYKVNLETLKQSTLDPSNIKVDLNGHIKTYGEGGYSSPILSEASKSYQIYEDVIGPNSSKTFNLRLWVKEDAVTSEVENKTFTSKISVSATARSKYSEATLVKGQEFNLKIKQLANSSITLYFADDTNITSIQRSESAPTTEDNYVDVAEQSSQTPVYAWFKDGIIYLYSEANKIFMNSSCFAMFAHFNKLNNIDLTMFDTSKVTDMSNMFLELSYITQLDLTNFDTSNVESMRNMFLDSYSIAQLDLSSFDTSSVTNMSSMFAGLSHITNLNISTFNTYKVVNMSTMFKGLSVLSNLDLTSFKTTNVVDMSKMFLRMYIITNIDLSSFDTSNVTNMSDMFSGMQYLTNLDLSSFDTSNVTDMSNMFRADENLTNLNLSSFDTSKVTNMSWMFERNLAITYLDLSSFDTSKVTNMTYMFNDNKLLTTIVVSNKWNTNMVTSSILLFKNCNKLVGGAGTTYRLTTGGIEYARIDDPDNGKPGYLTLKTN